MKLENVPLVSIIVITYNSSKYVLETLESAKAQTYQNIELIVSDDCSTDDTIEVCQNWLNKNEERFVRTELLTVSQNTGIPANCNRGYKAAKGEWIKGIAGDDVLVNTAIQNYVLAITSNTVFLVGQIQPFNIDKNRMIILKDIDPEKYHLKFFDLSASQQHKYLLTKSFNFAPSVFLKKCLFEKYGTFNEKYKFIEDLPYWLHLTSCNIKFDYLPIVTVFYRTGHESMVFSNEHFFNIKFYNCLYLFRTSIIYPQIPIWNISFYQSELFERICYYIIVNIFKNKKTKITKILYKVFCNLRINTILYKLKRGINSISTGTQGVHDKKSSENSK
ncbi:Spore coat polysaccharide biosynthesis protein SpsA [termite gut metagenome]|uniref:Spore coat polysaccharide biosynthesis protein SpsA n=1 Tax=termite gut metagenome TaxID=433724 RepID=A0A5J4RKI8_9ZZZZ